jgi:asparagine synthase (glutamine-hydrolysing)
VSAIAGILFFDGAPVEPGLIERLTHAMRTRGPDAQTHWTQGSIALGHCMLRATPESLVEQQPLLSIDGQLAIVWDGRLDNRDELYADLKARGARFRNESDAELALVAYEYYGEKTPEKFLGDFAFAVWNQRTQSLFLARDHVGARPFYYTQTDRFFAFASEDEVLLSLPGVRDDVCLDRVAYTLIPQFTCLNREDSWLDAIKGLLPATYFVKSIDRRSRKVRYWRLTTSAFRKEFTDEESIEAFRFVFEAAVKARLRTNNGVVGSLMSGGMDSASIAAAASHILEATRTPKLATFSIVSDWNPVDLESLSILKMVERLNLRPHVICVADAVGLREHAKFTDLLERLLHPIDSVLLLQGELCRIAQSEGVRVLLHGASGDAVTRVSDHYLLHTVKTLGLAAAYRELKAVQKNHTYVRGLPTKTLLIRSLASGLRGNRLLRPFAQRRALFRLLHEPIESRYEELANRTHALKRIRAVNSLAARRPSSIESAVESGDLLEGLEGYERVSGKFGIEFRDPFADRRVVEYFHGSALATRVRNGFTKYVVRKAYESACGADVVWRHDKDSVGSIVTREAIALLRTRKIQKQDYEQLAIRVPIDTSYDWEEVILSAWFAKHQAAASLRRTEDRGILLTK